jgi:hypothetical protein
MHLVHQEQCSRARRTSRFADLAQQVDQVLLGIARTLSKVA